MLQILSIAFCGVGDHLPLHNLLLRAAARGHNVTVGVENQTHCGSGIWPVPEELQARFRFVEFGSLSAEPPALANACDAQSAWFSVLAATATGSVSDFETTGLVVQRTLLPILRPSSLWLHGAIRALPTTSNVVVVTHQMFTNAHDVAKLLGVAYVSLWMSAVDLNDLLGHLCGGLAIADLQASFWLRLQSLGCVANLVRHADMGLLDPLRQALIVELGGKPSDLVSMMQLNSRVRQIVTALPGFARPAAVSPLITYVGPLVHSTEASPKLASSDDLHATTVLPFLLANANNRVVVLAFGSTAVPPIPFVDALVGGAAALLREHSDLRFLIAASFRAPDFERALARLCGDACQDRVVVARWIKQRAVISLPQVVAVGSHCGWGSLGEVLFFGKSVLAYPFMFDQHDNAQRAVEWGAALRIDHHSANASQVARAIDQLISEPRFANAAKRFQVAARFAGGVERGVDVLEATALLGISHLTPDRLVSFYDAIAFVVLLAAALLFGAFRCCRALYARRRSF
jgi:hypothetical protein